MPISSVTSFRARATSTGDPKAGALGGLLDLGAQPGFNHRFEVVGGVLAEEAAALLQGFFRRRRRADGSYKLQQFVMALVFGAVGVATIILGEYRPAAAAAIAARPNPLYGLLKGVGLPVDAALGSVNQMLKAVGLK
jgi:hypothetical protein